jgi:lipopolysaccharide assembly outer membrane protein LptD (OstA)
VPETRLRQLSLDNVVLDGADRVGPANLLTAGFGNRFYSGPSSQEAGGGRRLLAEFDLSVAWDFAGEGAGDPQLAVFEGEILGMRHLRTSFNFAYDLDHTRVEQGMLDLAVPLAGRLGLLPSSYVSLGYRYRQAIPLFFENFEIARVDEVGGGFGRFTQSFSRINQVTARTRLRLSERWAIEYEAGYSLHRSLVLTNRGAIEFTSACRCWAIQLQAENDRTQGIQGGLRFTFLGLGSNLENPFAGGGMLGTGLF